MKNDNGVYGVVMIVINNEMVDRLSQLYITDQSHFDGKVQSL